MTEDPYNSLETSLNMSEYLERIGLLSVHQKDLLIQRLRTNPEHNAYHLALEMGYIEPGALDRYLQTIEETKKGN